MGSASAKRERRGYPRAGPAPSMRSMQRLLGLAGAAALAACGGDAARVELAPVRVDGSSCGRPDDARVLRVTALGEQRDDVRAVELGAPVDIADFPATTRQLEVEILGAGGAVRALGRTAPLELAALADGDDVPIFMAPPDDGCPVAPMLEARDAPLVIAAGDGALVVGGRGAGGALLGTAEWYDPATGAFEAVATPPAMRGPRGAAGMAAATLPDGRVVLVGGDRPIYVVFDPATRSFATPGAIFELRAHAAAVALDATRIFVAAGCGLLDDAGACVAGSGRARSFVVDVATGDVVDGPALARERIDGAAFRQPAVDGSASGARVLVAGGDADAEWIDLDTGDGDVVAGTGAAAAMLPSGSVLTAFAPGGAAPAGTVAIAAPVAGDARAEVPAAPRAGAALVALEDGEVLVVGGDDAAPVARYRASAGAVIAADVDPVALDGAPLGRAGHGAARLPDGTVLVAGGRDAGGAPLAGAWVYRPSGDGPFAGQVTVTPAAETETPLVPVDPARVEIDPAYTLDAAGDALASWAVIGGIRPRDLTVTATLTIEGGAALLFGFADPATFDRVELTDRARLIRRDGGGERELCAGEPVEPGGAAAAVALDVRDGAVTARLGDRVVLACALDARAGLVGVAPRGDGARVTVSTISVVR